ncbi:hypothetical protein CHRY9390_00173 [Chryseobacterium aquaeductus]|uniref:Protein BatD n=1 Tax=Chryseobacterium aquaeductus TaxID=2675056 RepID=A0A9N8QR20_9FLAO|nr:hypothetical protein [Chryseobacterium aquaeductus]CAA7329534.1 hypothetical protein CHRY9390_00173 [Chryseobacterium potabilaquae]CAD7797463.1 hypothetical protein CHRY9390_00173 [Chryseobacterium aquaeductus]
MNRSFFLCLLFFCTLVSAQVSFTSWTNSYLQINSYNGNTNPDAYTVTFAANGNLNMPHWRLSARLKQNITSGNGQYTIPANKVSFQPISSTGQAYPNPIPSISEIGIPLNVVLQNNDEVFLVPQSNVPFYNAPAQPNGYYNLQLKYAMSVLGGSYLGSFPAWTTFYAPIEFTAYDQYNSIIGKISHTFQFQIGSITGTPPIVDEMSLKVNMNAANGILEFKSMQDYTNGTSVTYSNGLMVTSSSNFQIKVRSLQNELISASGNTIPVGVIHLVLFPTSTVNQTIFPITLSLSNQTLAKATSSSQSSYNYDIKYFTTAQDERLINAKPEDYSTTLQYEIVPQ